MTTRYDDIIDLPRPVSRRERMPMSARAAQFSPFAALSGHEAAIRETARLTSSRIDLDEQSREVLERSLLFLKNEGIGQEVTCTYFRADRRKAGGTYLTRSGQVKAVETTRKRLVFEDGTSIPFDDLLEISGLPDVE